MQHNVTELAIALLPALFLFGQAFLASTGQRFLEAGQRAVRIARDDWRGTRYLSYGCILLLITAAIIAAYYVNNPQPKLYPDSLQYFQVTRNMLTQGTFVDVLRTPGYPMFMAFIFLVAGAANTEAVSAAQGVLFLLATLELYVLTILLFRRAWIALSVGLLMGTNLYLLSIVKPMLSEGMGLWLVASLALLVVLLVQRWQLRYLWLVVLCTLLLFMTRPEWIYLPVPLFAYLLFLAWRRGKLRRFLPHSLVALALLYALLGLYSYANGVQNGYFGITDNQRGNLFGKILQYHMQNEAPPQYAQVTTIIDASKSTDPIWIAWIIYPPLGANHWALAGAYSQAIVAHHPLEFLADTIPVFFTSLDERTLYSQISVQGPFASPLLLLQNISAHSYETYAFFPLFALFWIILLFWRRTSRLPLVEGMGAVVLLALYGLILTSLGGFIEYTRLHVSFDSMMLVVIWGALLASLPFGQSLLARERRQWRAVGFTIGVIVVGAFVASIMRALVVDGPRGALDPHLWMVEHLVVKHPALTLVGLVLAGFLVWLVYRTAHRGGPAEKLPALAAGEALQQELLDGAQEMSPPASEPGFSEGVVQGASPASHSP